MYVHAVEITRSLQQKGTPVTKNIPERINHHQPCMKVCTKTIPEPILKKTPLLSGHVQILKQSRGRANSELFQLTSRFNHEYIIRAYSYMCCTFPHLSIITCMFHHTYAIIYAWLFLLAHNTMHVSSQRKQFVKKHGLPVQNTAAAILTCTCTCT